MELLAIVIGFAVIIAAVIAWRWFRSNAGPETTALPQYGAATEEVRGAGRLRTRLAKTRSALGDSISSLFNADAPDEAPWEALEDALILADVGPGTASTVVAQVRARSPQSAEEASSVLADVLLDLLGGRPRALNLDGDPAAIIVVGVNGAGKTTSIAKLAKALVADGHGVTLGAADTFRAAADHQLIEWGNRVGVEVITGEAGSDPASVAFAAVAHARSAKDDVVIVDTAGRLHSQANLMQELSKVTRVVEREAGSVSEVLLVLDGTTGQNGIAQAKAFADAVGVTGIVLTKLDGTAKGGIAVAVEHQLDIPIKYIGVGEGMDDMMPFVPVDFVEALITS